MNEAIERKHRRAYGVENLREGSLNDNKGWGEVLWRSDHGKAMKGGNSEIVTRRRERGDRTEAGEEIES